MKTQIYVPRYDPVEMLAVLQELQEVVTMDSSVTLHMTYDDNDVLYVEYETCSTNKEVMEGLVLLLLPQYKWST